MPSKSLTSSNPLGAYASPKPGDKSRKERRAEVVLRRLSALCELSDEEAQLVLAIGARTQTYAAGQFLQYEEEAYGAPKFFISGWAARIQFLSDGRRQISGFLLPGDGAGLNRNTRLARSSIQALTAIVTADARDFMETANLRDKHSGIKCALDRSDEHMTIQLLNHVVRLGRLSAYERFAHLIMELHHRLSVINLATGTSMPFPLTQENLGDALGLSTVHIHRTMKQMRREGTFYAQSGVAYLRRMETLASVSGFKPSRID